MAEQPTHRVTSGASNKGIVGGRTPGEIAREAIPLLEKAIFDEFGLKVKMGAELEFCLSGREPALDHMPKKNTGIPSRLKHKSEQVQLFELSPIVSAFYRETEGDTEKDIVQYEIVFSHNHPGDDARYLADAINHIKLKLQAQEPLHDTVYNPREEKRIERSVGNYFKKVSFDSIIPLYILQDSVTKEELPVSVSNGLHLNISLWDGNRNVLHAMPHEVTSETPALNTFEKGLQYAIGMAFQHNLPAISPSHLSYKRFQDRKLDLSEIRFRKRTPTMVTGPTHYIENRIPGADSDPSTAIMLSLAGVYEGLRQLAYEKGKAEFKAPEITDNSIPASRFESEVLLNYKNPVKDTLNIVQKGLGDAFHNAVLAQVGKGQGPSPAG